ADYVAPAEKAEKPRPSPLEAGLHRLHEARVAERLQVARARERTQPERDREPGAEHVADEPADFAFGAVAVDTQTVGAREDRLGRRRGRVTVPGSELVEGKAPRDVDEIGGREGERRPDDQRPARLRPPA